MSRGTPTITLRLDPALRAAVQAKAAERGETLTDVVRRALVEYVEDAPRAERVGDEWVITTAKGYPLARIAGW